MPLAPKHAPAPPPAMSIGVRLYVTPEAFVRVAGRDSARPVVPLGDREIEGLVAAH